MRFLDKVERCNRRDLTRYLPFVADGRQLGWITPERTDVLLSFSTVFTPPSKHRGVTFIAALATPEARSAAVAAIIPDLPRALFATPRGELYGIKNHWAEAQAFRLDRALVPAFGARAYGVHLNGYVRRGDEVALWIGTRADNLKVEPGKRDNMVAGGQPASLSLMDNLVKECGEEAHLDPAFARRAAPSSLISYAFDAPEGLRADTLFCYDLEMPENVIPRPSEEIIRFDLMPIGEVLALVRDSDTFKFNVGLVILDFAIRHGFIGPETEPDYEAIASGLRERPQPLV
jgi:hypothetical protein